MRNVIGLVAGFVGVALVAGCGSATSAAPTVSTTGLTPVAAVTKVAESARSTSSAAYTFTMSGPTGLSITGHGAYSNTPRTAMDMVFDSASMSGLGQMTGLEERLVGDVLYLKMPMLGTLTGGKWLKISLRDAGAGAGIDLGSLLQQSAAADPSKQLQALLSSPNVHEVGAETIDGVPTTHYSGEVTLADIEKNSTYDAATKAALSKLYAGSVHEVSHLDVWVDSAYRARRFSATTPTPAGTATVTMNFTDYGSAVSVAAPAASQVTDLSDDLGSFGLGSGTNSASTAPTGATF